MCEIAEKNIWNMYQFLRNKINDSFNDRGWLNLEKQTIEGFLRIGMDSHHTLFHQIPFAIDQPKPPSQTILWQYFFVIIIWWYIPEV